MFQTSPDSMEGQPEATTTVGSPPGSYKPPQNLFLLHNIHRRFLDGSSRYLWNMKATLLWGTVLLIVGVTLLIYPIPDVLMANKVEQSGIMVKAFVTARRSVGTSSTEYFVLFHYQTSKDIEAPDADVSSEQQVSLSTFHRLAEGTSVTVSYDANNPRMARLAGSDVDDSVIIGRIPSDVIGGLFFLLAAALSYRAHFRIKRLSRDGQLMEGTLTMSRLSRWRGNYQLFVKYSFKSPNGLVLEGKGVVRSAKHTHLQVAVGTPVVVLYADDKTYIIL